MRDSIVVRSDLRVTYWPWQQRYEATVQYAEASTYSTGWTSASARRKAARLHRKLHSS